MKVIYNLYASYEDTRSGKLLEKSIELEGSTDDEINEEFGFYLNNTFYNYLDRECDRRFENVELDGKLQDITICIERDPEDEDGNIIDEDCTTNYEFWSYHPFIGLEQDEKEAQRLLNEQLEMIIKEEEEERNF